LNQNIIWIRRPNNINIVLEFILVDESDSFANLYFELFGSELNIG